MSTSQMLAEEVRVMRDEISVEKNACVRQRMCETLFYVQQGMMIGCRTPVRLNYERIDGLLEALREVREDAGSSAGRDRDFLRRTLSEELSVWCSRSCS